MDVPGLTIDPLEIPPTLAADDGSYAEMVRVRNRVETDTLGSDVLAVEPARLLAEHLDPYAVRRIFLARLDGRVVGRMFVEFPQEEGSRIAQVEAQVLAEVRNRGIGVALLRAAESLAAEAGRDVLQAWLVHRAVRPGEAVVTPPTGAGALPAADPGTQFLLAHDWRLEQIYRISLLNLTAAAAATRTGLERGRAGAGDDYEALVWSGPSPDEHLGDLGRLMSRMSTDAPQAGLEVDAEDWTPERYRSMEQLAADAGTLFVTAAVRHRASDRLVAFSYVTIPSDRALPADHGDTLVLREHRGHRLGLYVKAALHDAIPAFSPATSLITTFNAEENRYMLDVNEALGYVPIGYQGTWEKRTGRS